MLQKTIIEAWIKTSNELRIILEKGENSTYSERWETTLKVCEARNPWFTKNHIETAIRGIIQLCEPEKLKQFASRYIDAGDKPRQVGVIMAGNIPASGFHDTLCVTLSGHKLFAKLSSSDNVLLPFIVTILSDFMPDTPDRIVFAENLKNMDAIIATGSNNTARYFEYYFGKQPHIFRKNRNSAAVITGHENEYDFMLLGKDIFTYFGLGCRSISKLFVPENYNFDSFFQGMVDYGYLLQHSRYMNNHDYYQAIYLLNNEPFLTNNFLILKEDNSLSSPVGVIFFEYYKNEKELNSRLDSLNSDLQCIVSKESKWGIVAPGKTQFPSIEDFADGIDTMDFLSSLN